MLNFKIDHPSIFVYEGIDYTEKRKELKQLVLNEVTTISDSRRTRNGVTYVDISSFQDDIRSHKTRSVVKLPAMFPHQVTVRSFMNDSFTRSNELKSWLQPPKRTLRIPLTIIPLISGCQ